MAAVEIAQPTDVEILDKEIYEDRFVLHCRVPADLLYFEGHFQRAAVVAGVVQLKWVMDAIAGHAYRPQLAGMEAVKFHQLLFPRQSFRMEVKHDLARAKWSYWITSHGKKIASGRLLERVEAQNR